MSKINASFVKGLVVMAAVGALGSMLAPSFAVTMHTSAAFMGAKVNGGTVTHSMQNGKSVLTLSDDFVAPGTPDPHWQLVDSNGNVYLVDKLMIKTLTGGSTVKKTITVPAYVHDVAKVQIWCAWAETLLGEASFSTPVR